jgi:hypothetical protein
MRYLFVMLAIAGFLGLPARADQTTSGGISGTVVDVRTHQPIANATILYYKAPWLDNGANQLHTLNTDRRGFFSDITLPPGRYVLMARVPGRVMGCAVDDVQTAETARVKIELGRDVMQCSGPRVHPMMVDPNVTASLYRI